jgi:hypothetical protein
MLSARDHLILSSLGDTYRVFDEEGFLVIIIDGFPMPKGMVPQSSTVLVRLPPGFPDAAPDMFWLDPAVHAVDGRVFPGTEASQIFIGRSWQRWSRHIQQEWRPGIDNLSTYMAYIRRCLDHAIRVAA